MEEIETLVEMRQDARLALESMRAPWTIGREYLETTYEWAVGACLRLEEAGRPSNTCDADWRRFASSTGYHLALVVGRATRLMCKEEK